MNLIKIQPFFATPKLWKSSSLLSPDLRYCEIIYQPLILKSLIMFLDPFGHILEFWLMEVVKHVVCVW